MPENENEVLQPDFPKVAPMRQILYNVKVEPAQTYLYSNVAGLAISPWDMRINFAEVQPTGGDGVIAKTVAGIVLTPEHAAGLALLLFMQLMAYEKQFGQIRHPAWAHVRTGLNEEELARGVAEVHGPPPEEAP